MNDIITWVPCRVLKEVGYHDIHYPGEEVLIDQRHVQEMVDYGYIEVISFNFDSNESAQ